MTLIFSLDSRAPFLAAGASAPFLTHTADPVLPTLATCSQALGSCGTVMTTTLREHRGLS